jgi:hypothetical protein
MTEWGEIEVHPEVEAWLDALPADRFDRAARAIDFLAERGVHLGEPQTRQLRGKLRELRIHLGQEQVRITYFIASGRRIVLLTIFRKAARRERAEIERAEREMTRCIAAGHTPEEDERE